MVNGFEKRGGPDSSPEQEKSLLAAMAIKRWVRGVPNAQIVGGETYISSRDIEAALLGEGLQVVTRIDLTRDGFPRVSAAQGSVGFDEGLEITKVADNRYQIRMLLNK